MNILLGFNHGEDIKDERKTVWLVGKKVIETEWKFVFKKMIKRKYVAKNL